MSGLQQASHAPSRRFIKRHVTAIAAQPTRCETADVDAHPAPIAVSVRARQLNRYPHHQSERNATDYRKFPVLLSPSVRHALPAAGALDVASAPLAVNMRYISRCCAAAISTWSVHRLLTIMTTLIHREQKPGDGGFAPECAGCPRPLSAMFATTAKRGPTSKRIQRQLP